MACGLGEVVRQLIKQLTTITPVVPVQRHIDWQITDQFDQLATGYFSLHLQLRDQPPAEPGLSQTDKALR